MPELDADFEISTNNLEAEYEISEGQTFDCSFEIYASGATFSSIVGNPYDNEALSDVLNQKADSSVVETLSDTVNNIEDTIDSYGNIVTYDYTDFATAWQGLKADTALQPNDNISELVNNVGYLVLTDLDNYATLSDLATKQDIINDLTDIRSNASKGASAYTTIQSYGDIVTHNVSEFATSAQGSLADTALQPNDNITELNNNAGYITAASLPTVNNSKITIQRNNTDIGDFNLNQAQPKSINISVPTQASDIGAVPTTRTVNNKALNTNITLSPSDVSALPSSTTIEDLTTTAQQNAINSGATTTKIGQITTNANDIADIQDLIPIQATSTNQLADKSFVNSSIATNTANFIGTFQSVQDLEAYSGTLTNNDYAFVETTDSVGNTLYDRYKWNGTQWLFEYELNNSSFTANQWASINSGITSSDVALINTALQPNDNITELTNNAGYITNADLSGYAQISDIPTDVSELNNDSGYITGITSSDVTTALGYTPYNSTNPNGYISGIGSSDVISALGYTPYNSTNPNGYITGISSSDVTTALGYTPYNSTNPNGYTSNVGTVTSVNNTQPDANGNVTISVSGGANTDLSNLTATGESHFQAPLVSGTNIKTINNASILGSGNLNVGKNIGEIVYSTIPLTDAGLHLLDGTLLQYGSYQAFIDYISGLVSDYPNLFCTEADWQTSVSTYGSCGKFVYDSINNTVRLPKITGFTEGTIDPTSLGDLTEAGLPNIEGSTKFGIGSSIVGTTTENAFVSSTKQTHSYSCSSGSGGNVFSFDASNFDTIYGNSSTVQPQSIKVLYYIVLANLTKTEIEVDIDEIATDLNGKADKDLQNINSNIVSIPPTSLLNFDSKITINQQYVTPSTSAGTKTIDIASYLPNDNYTYLVLTRMYVNNNSSFSGLTVTTDLVTMTNFCGAGQNGRYAQNSDWLPVGLGRTMTVSIGSAIGTTLQLEFIGYRRVGTNS